MLTSQMHMFRQDSRVCTARVEKRHRWVLSKPGTDEVGFNSGDGHYILPFCTAACRTDPPTAPEQIGVIDSTGFQEDQSVAVTSATTTPGSGGMRRFRSTAADSSTNQVYVAIAAIGGGAPTYAPTVCSSAPTKVGSPTDATGCIAVFKSSGER
jgi:hypothetical protein